MGESKPHAEAITVGPGREPRVELFISSIESVVMSLNEARHLQRDIGAAITRAEALSSLLRIEDERSDQMRATAPADHEEQ